LSRTISPKCSVEVLEAGFLASSISPKSLPITH
jgi:hypothetical protein